MTKDRFGRSWALRCALLYLPIIGLYTWGWPLREAKLSGIRLANDAALWLGHRLCLPPVRPGWQDFFIAAVQLVGAAFVALIWTALERRPKTNVYLSELVAIGARYDLAVAMFYYGVAKIGLTQGGQPGPLDWVRPVGEMPLSSLMWMWLGYSRVYEFFGGLIEFTAAALLLFRRTALLGVVLVLPTLVYVVVIDSNYGAGPKAQAAQYALLALMIVAPDFPRLADCFVHRRPTHPRPIFRGWTPTLRVLGTILRVLIVAWIVYFDLYRQARTTINASARSPLAGVYEVERFESNFLPGDPAGRWHLVAINRIGDFIRVRTLGGKDVILREIGVRWDEHERADAPLNAARSAGPIGRIAFEIAPEIRSRRQYLQFLKLFGQPPSPGDPRSASLAVFDYDRLDPGRLRLTGVLRGEKVRIDLRRIDDDQFALYRTQ